MNDHDGNNTLCAIFSTRESCALNHLHWSPSDNHSFSKPINTLYYNEQELILVEIQQQNVSDLHGISARMDNILAAILPSAGREDDHSAGPADRSASIDLATAENWLLREELLPICKNAIAQGLTTKVSLSFLCQTRHTSRETNAEMPVY